jgi:hypothetical protein
MHHLKNFDEYFDTIHKEKYGRNSIRSDKFYIFKNIEVIVSKGATEDSLDFKGLLELNELLSNSKHFTDKNKESTINFVRRELGRLKIELYEEFYFGWKYF